MGHGRVAKTLQKMNSKCQYRDSTPDLVEWGLACAMVSLPPRLASQNSSSALTAVATTTPHVKSKSPKALIRK